MSGAGTWATRRALTLVIEDQKGRLGLGEAAPLPGYSRDTLERARGDLRALLGRQLPERDPGSFGAQALGITSAGLESASARMASAGLESASARMAVETALLDLWARQAEAPAWALLTPAEAVNAPLALSLWLPDDTDQALASARAAWARGTRSFKVKCGRLDTADPGLSLLEALRSALGPEAELRADANQSATRAAFEAASARLTALGVAWVEEPAAEAPTGLSAVPIALDESLAAETPDFAPARASGAVALVLKPTVLGGLGRALELARRGREAGLTAVVSHALEGPVAYAASAALALSLGTGRPADGLAPHPGLGARRPSCLDPALDRLVAWTAPGLDVSLDDALAGRTVLDEVRG